jgi:Cu(I)/Ag(I) efflux system periplasmic protein CusF
MRREANALDRVRLSLRPANAGSFGSDWIGGFGMTLRHLRCFLLGLVPIALAACVKTEAVTDQPTSMAPAIGVDLGNSSRVPRIAGLAGEGEGYARTEPASAPVQHGSRPEIDHQPGMQMDHGSMAGMGHDSMSGMPMDHGSMSGMPMGHGSMMGTNIPSGTASAHGSMSGMQPPVHKMEMAHSGHTHAQGTGTVNSVDPTVHKINISHRPIPTIGWPAMTMDFAVAASVDLRGVQPGTRINFTIEQGDDGMYVIQSITPAGERR